MDPRALAASVRARVAAYIGVGEGDPQARQESPPQAPSAPQTPHPLPEVGSAAPKPPTAISAPHAYQPPYRTDYAGSLGPQPDGMALAELAAQLLEELGDILAWATTTHHGFWLSRPDDPWQNACAAVEINPGTIPHVKDALAELARDFGQHSIAWAEAPTTEFIGSSK